MASECELLINASAGSVSACPESRRLVRSGRDGIAVRNRPQSLPVLVHVRDGRVSEATRGAAIERLYREEGERLWRAVLFWCGDREVASDAVAEAFAQVLHRAAAVRDPRAWVWRTAFRVAAGDLHRRRRMTVERHETVYELPDAPVLLATALARLSPKERASVVLHYYARYPLKEVAAIIGSTHGAVAVHLHRARKRLREVMDDEGRPS